MSSQEELHRVLGNLEGKQDLILEKLNKLTEEHTGVSKRVDKVEKRMTYVAGIWAAVAAGAVYFKDFIFGGGT